MKKYTPSVKNNNELRDSVASELKALIYRMEKGKFASELDRDAVATQVSRLKGIVETFENTICCGDENIGSLANDALNQIKKLKRQADQSMTHRFESAAEDLICTVELWKDVIDGITVMDTEEEIEREKISRSRKKLNARLDELAEIKQSFIENDKRLTKELSEFEKDLYEHKKALMGEDDQRKINDLYRSIKAIESKIDMLTVRHGNYSACYNLLDLIYANAKEILEATDFASEEVGKAKALLNIEQLKKVVVYPDKAIVILKCMDEDVKAIAVRTASLDNKVFGLDKGTITVSTDALQYKEELLREQREKEALANLDQSATTTGASKTKIGTEE